MIEKVKHTLRQIVTSLKTCLQDYWSHDKLTFETGLPVVNKTGCNILIIEANDLLGKRWEVAVVHFTHKVLNIILYLIFIPHWVSRQFPSCVFYEVPKSHYDYVTLFITDHPLVLFTRKTKTAVLYKPVSSSVTMQNWSISSLVPAPIRIISGI